MEEPLYTLCPIMKLSAFLQSKILLHILLLNSVNWISVSLSGWCGIVNFM